MYLIGMRWKKLKKPFIIVAVLFNLLYIIWRGTLTIPMFSWLTLTLGIILFGAELMDFFSSLAYRIIFVKDYKIKFQSINVFRTAPSVDLFISTFNEPREILERTVAGCRNLDYPKDKLSIYICDDGHRDEIRLLAEEYEIGYITRETNEHAKAGNLNNALKMTNGEFIMLLDADMIPKSYFLRRTMGYMSNKEVALVQTPQVFYNSDPFQNNLQYYREIPNEQDFFMRFIEAGRAAYNVVLHVGTNAVFRRSVLEELGGFPTGSVTEDLATGILIQSRGYQTIFVNEPLAFGLSTDTFADLVRQRRRWARGNIQVLKKWGPFRLKGLTLTQKYIYVAGIVYWFAGLQKLMFIISPIIFLLTGVPLVATNLYNLLLFALPSIASSFLIFKYLSGNNRTLFWANIYEIALAPYLAKAAFTELVFNKQIDFNVTSKEKKVSSKHFNFTMALPHLTLFVLSVLGIVVGLYKLYFNLYSYSSIMVNLIWCCYNIVGVFMSILLCVERPKPEDEENITLTNRYIELMNTSNGVRTIFNLWQMSLHNMMLYKNDYFVDGSFKIGDEVELCGSELEGVKGTVHSIYEKDNKLFFRIVFNQFTKPEMLKIVPFVFDNSQGYTIVDFEFISKY